MDLTSALAPTAYTTALLGAGTFLLYAVGGSFDNVDLLLMVLGAAPVAAFGMVAFGWSPRLGRA